MMLAPIASILVLTLLGVIAFSFAGCNRTNVSDSIALAIIGVFVALVSFALIRQEGFATNDLWQRPAPAVEAAPSDVKVWMDSATGLYYCAGSKEFSHGKPGHFANQKQAKLDYYKPASGKPCP